MLGYHPDWSRISRSTGYAVVFCPDHPRAWSTGYVYVHTIVMEKKLGRLLEDGEIVHHKDLTRTNDDPDNLELKTQSKHASEHAIRVAPVEMICAHCKKPFPRKRNQRPENKGYKLAFCSRRCNGLHYAQAKKMPP